MFQQFGALIADPETLIIVFSAIVSFLTVVAIGSQMLNRDTLEARKKAVQERRAELSQAQRERLSSAKKVGRAKRVDLMKRFLQKIRLQNLIASPELKAKLAQAGRRGENNAVYFSFARVALSAGMAAASLFFVLTAKEAEFSLPITVGLVGGSAVMGFYLPGVFLSNLIQRRQKELSEAFPDALDLLTICVEAGLGLEAAFARVAEEMGATSPSLSEELGLTTAELAFLGDRKAAFENMAIRTGLESFKSLSTALLQSEKYGTPVSSALRVLSQDNRDHRMTMAEKKAGALPAQLTVPMILFFLPVLFMVILGPAVIQFIRLT